MKRKVLICGATGFIGRNLTEQLSKRMDLEIHAVRYHQPEYNCPNITWHQADLRESSDVAHIMSGMDIVIQAAATTANADDLTKRPYVYATDNAVMNSYIFRAAFENQIKHLVFFSCSSIYQSAEFPLKEMDFDANQPLNPNYFGVGSTKLYLEKMCEFYSKISETKFTAIRHSNIYGPHDKFDLEHSHVLGATIGKVMTAKDKIIVWGTGEETRDLLYIDDLVEFVERSLEKQTAKFGLYNCGYGHGIAIRDLVRKIIAQSGKRLEIEHDLLRPTIKTSIALDCELAKNDLGWAPKTTLDDGIKKTIAWYKANISAKEPAHA